MPNRERELLREWFELIKHIVSHFGIEWFSDKGQRLYRETEQILEAKNATN